ncbi:hypothetical protein M595_3400 [Lyngbya aestuarii BL J]|uniref:Uncharacterized protein n=1 Tax=Lyngbya aestuarii BL J TaxID=1348334 RepID=U7QHA1_9CYAN|nr:hypothetical protein M595_3400 [Lyngbya aestuarii BL J]
MAKNKRLFINIESLFCQDGFRFSFLRTEGLEKLRIEQS